MAREGRGGQQRRGAGGGGLPVLLGRWVEVGGPGPARLLCRCGKARDLWLQGEGLRGLEPASGLLSATHGSGPVGTRSRGLGMSRVEESGLGGGAEPAPLPQEGLGSPRPCQPPHQTSLCLQHHLLGKPGCRPAGRRRKPVPPAPCCRRSSSRGPPCTTAAQAQPHLRLRRPPLP